MSRLAVFTFDSAGAASQVRSALRDLEKRKELGLDDAMVLARDQAGSVSRRGNRSRAVLAGAIAGGVTGLLLTFMFPVIGILFGAGAGALLVRLLQNQRIDADEVTTVEAALRPGTSALLLLLRPGEVSAAMTSILRGAHAQVYQTTLSPEMDASLRQSLQ
jgi:uncharacterized membrane protein